MNVACVLHASARGRCRTVTYSPVVGVSRLPPSEGPSAAAISPSVIRDRRRLRASSLTDLGWGLPNIGISWTEVCFPGGSVLRVSAVAEWRDPQGTLTTHLRLMIGDYRHYYKHINTQEKESKLLQFLKRRNRKWNTSDTITVLSTCHLGPQRTRTQRPFVKLRETYFRESPDSHNRSSS